MTLTPARFYDENGELRLGGEIEGDFGGGLPAWWTVTDDPNTVTMDGDLTVTGDVQAANLTLYSGGVVNAGVLQTDWLATDAAGDGSMTVYAAASEFQGAVTISPSDAAAVALSVVSGAAATDDGIVADFKDSASVSRLTITSAGEMRLTNDGDNSAFAFRIRDEASGEDRVQFGRVGQNIASFAAVAAPDFSLVVGDDGSVAMPSLPSSDPGVPGRLYQVAGAVMVSL